MLFSNERKHTVTLPARLPDGSHPNISFLVQYLVDNVMRDERKEFFVLEDNVYVPVYRMSSVTQTDSNNKAARDPGSD